MGINKYNSEGYYDPTVYEAFSHIEKEEKAARRVYRPLVYICSPYAGDVERNVNMARLYSCFAVRNNGYQSGKRPHFGILLEGRKRNR